MNSLHFNSYFRGKKVAWEIYKRKATVALLNGKEFDKEDYNTSIDKFQEQWVNAVNYEASAPIGRMAERNTGIIANSGV